MTHLLQGFKRKRVLALLLDEIKAVEFNRRSNHAQADILSLALSRKAVSRYISVSLSVTS